VLRQVARQLVRTHHTRDSLRGADAPPASPATRPPELRRETARAFPRLGTTVVRAPATAVAAADAASARQDPARAGTSGGRAERDAPARAGNAISLPPRELSRVTDHVLRQLDRRVLSYRERLGRIV
jgi:hypothetical protein